MGAGCTISLYIGVETLVEYRDPRDVICEATDKFKGDNNSKFFRELSLQTSSTFRFLIPLNVKTKVDGKKLTAVAEAIEKINPPLEKGKKRLKNDTDVDGNLQKQSHQKKNKHRITHTSTNVEISSDEETLQTMKKKYVKKMSAPRNTKTKKLVEIKKEKP
ncbi:isoleucine--tRNA ligase [Striga asiatica]|uniref:Isoleucine--tRNA ligase n=1 Tax=Striga asiatica TaxID=4170 RepID=A0A5A7RJT2_STRAF|nr:isoleucine--tRNA ligase [Striga asiatica]